jgi:hypothetical protein
LGINDSSPETDCICRAFLLTIKARDTFLSAVVVHSEPGGFGFHGTDLIAGLAVYTLVISLRKYCGESVKQRQARSERAKHFAEESLVSHCEDNDEEEQTKPKGKRQNISRSVDDCPRDSGFHGCNRAKTAEIERESGAEEIGDGYYQYSQNSVFYEPGPRRD